MANWMLPNIIAYWDERVDAIERFSRVIAAAPEDRRPEELAAVSAAVAGHAQALSDQDIMKAAVPILDDLYKAAAHRTYLDEPLLQYLAASCGPFFEALTARGYVAQYIIDNTYDRLDGPVLAFRLWFSAAQLAYICPQAIACTAFGADRPSGEWTALVSKYLGDARLIAVDMVTRCANSGRHFVFLDTDASDETLGFVTKLAKTDGGILIVRKEAPVPGSQIVIRHPTAPRQG